MTIAAVGLTTGDFAYRLKDLPACLDRFAALGAEYVELSLGAFDIIANERILPARLKELKRICAAHPFKYTVHGPIASRFTVRRELETQVAVCRATLELSGEIGATAQVHHSGPAPWNDAAERERVYKMEREALAEIAPHAEACGVMLCVENIFSDKESFFLSPAELAEQIRVVDHRFIRATIDFSHAAINAGARGFDLMAELAALAPYAGHLHIHDSFGKPESFRPYTYGEGVNFGMGDLHLPPGWGALDWEAIAALPYAQPVVANLELSTRFEDDLEASITLCRRMMEISASR
ncbi:MAG: sugar phosphate isomerase/epimerase family protein [Pseudomonadota bacterium]